MKAHEHDALPTDASDCAQEPNWNYSPERVEACEAGVARRGRPKNRVNGAAAATATAAPWLGSAEEKEAELAEAERQRRAEAATAERIARERRERDALFAAEDAAGKQALAAGDLKVACDHNYRNTCTLLGWKNGCDSGSADACHDLGGVYWNGYEPIPADKQRGLMLYDRACSLAQTKCLDLGAVVMSGLGPVPSASLEPKIRSFFDRSCQVNADTCAKSCLFYEAATMDQDRSNFPPDILKQRKAFALACYKRACSAGSGSACALVSKGGNSGTLR